MQENKDLSSFEKGQIVMARGLGQSISEMTRLVGYFWSAVVRIYQQWCKKGQAMNAPMAHQYMSANYTVWSKPTEGLLWHKSHKIVMIIIGEMSQHTLGSIMTPVHR